MKPNIRRYLLGFFDLILSLGAILTGYMMISSDAGIFEEFPKEWLSKIPFHSWVMPGIIAIIVFGLGNMAAAISAFRGKTDNAVVISAGLAFILLICSAAQRIILGEWFLVDIYFVLLGTIQLFLSGRIYLNNIRFKMIK